MKQAVQLKVDATHYPGKVLSVADKIRRVDVNRHDSALAVSSDPLFIVVVDVLKILQLDIELVVPIPFLDLLHQLWNVGFQVNQQVWRQNKIDHGMKQVQVVLIVPVVHEPTGVEVRGENVSVLVNSPILDNCFVVLPDLADLVEAAVEKINLEVKRPLFHVIIEIAEIGVVIN